MFSLSGGIAPIYMGSGMLVGREKTKELGFYTTKKYFPQYVLWHNVFEQFTPDLDYFPVTRNICLRSVRAYCKPRANLISLFY